MKRSLLILPFLLMVACPPPNPGSPDDPYQKARLTISITKITVQTAKASFDGIATAVRQSCTVKVCTQLHPDTSSQAHLDCLQSDLSANAAYKKCDKVAPAVPWVAMGTKIMLQGCDTATEVVGLAAQLAQVREDKKLRSACDGGDQAACKKYQERVAAICLQVDPTKGVEYQNCVAGKPVAKANYVAMLKSSACLAYEAFKPIPANPKYDAIISGIRTWFKVYGNCP